MRGRQITRAVACHRSAARRLIVSQRSIRWSIRARADALRPLGLWTPARRSREPLRAPRWGWGVARGAQRAGSVRPRGARLWGRRCGASRSGARSPARARRCAGGASGAGARAQRRGSQRSPSGRSRSSGRGAPDLGRRGAGAEPAVCPTLGAQHRRGAGARLARRLSALTPPPPPPTPSQQSAAPAGGRLPSRL